MTTTWYTESLPSFCVHGFHTGRLVKFKLSDGTEHEDVYQGWGIFGKGRGYDWVEDEQAREVYASTFGKPYVTAWAEVPVAELAGERA